MRAFLVHFGLAPNLALGAVHHLEQGGWVDEGIPKIYSFIVTPEPGLVAGNGHRHALDHSNDAGAGAVGCPGNWVRRRTCRPSFDALIQGKLAEQEVPQDRI